jgi:hypothetical protein
VTTDPADSATSRAPELVRDDLIEDRALRESDADTLDHGPIAARVADLVTVSDKPLNVALFGAWGSGKSSFAKLLEVALKGKKNAPRLVRYNAWTFEGESFQRNFISSIATDLDMTEDSGNPDYIQFHSGLYETRRSGRLEMSRADVLKILGIFLGIFGAAMFILMLFAAGLAMLFGSTDPVKAAVDAAAGLIPATAVAALIASVAKEIVAGARVNIDKTAPTQEQFRATFEKLLQLASKDKGVKSLVFFIDELDRCAPEQVVTVLGAIRHFYDIPGCVFIVAADRQAIDEALQKKSEQATPLNTDSPYYSVAGEFIDKIFQHQLTLPPLRGRRLTRFARDLVLAKTAGLWKELSEVEEGRLLDQLVYVLIPSHVRSPRRVKVLLNTFATNARIAQARHVELVAHALALAKLVALRTEFPLFAADLPAEPRLPTLLLDPGFVTKPSLRLQELLERHRLPEVNQKTEDALTDTDTPLATTDDADQAKKLRFSERTLLRRYLVRTSEFANPSLDLLYLEPAGAAVDLADPEFGLELEENATEGPDDVIAAATTQEPEEQRKALRVLADIISSGDEFGPERANVVTTMLGIAGLVDFELGPSARDVLGALHQFGTEESFAPEQLADVLAVALIAGDSDLASSMLADDRLLADADNTARAASIADLMTKEQRAKVWGKVVEFYPTAPEILGDPLNSLPPAIAQELLEQEPLAAAIRTRLNGLAEPDALEEVKALIGRIRAADGETDGVLGTFLLRLPDNRGPPTRRFEPMKALSRHSPRDPTSPTSSL